MTEEINIYDAHCHPTDVPSKLNLIAGMKTKKLICMSTNAQDMGLVAKVATQYSDKVVPAFGYHPWFSYQLYDDISYFHSKPFNKTEHYKYTLFPEPTQEFIDDLPDPLPLSEVLETIKKYLKAFPNAVVGECGLDKAFRLPVGSNANNSSDSTNEISANRILSVYKVQLEHQKLVFLKQMELSVELNRPISVHAVQCPAQVYDIVQSGIYNKSQKTPAWPPAVCLHSYTGSSEFLKSTWYRPVSKRKQKAQNKHDSTEQMPLIYVSLSYLLNRKNIGEIASAVPDGLLLFESDFHAAGPEMDELNMNVLNHASDCLEVAPLTLSKRIESNFFNFIQSPK